MSSSSPPFRERLLDGLRSARENGIRIRRLAFGPPADPDQIARVERDHLGFPMPPVMRSFFREHDGASLFFHTVDDPAAEIYDPAVPLTIDSADPILWNDAMHDGGALWRQIDEVDFGVSERGCIFYVGLFCVPRLAEMFDTDWTRIFGWPPGMYLFDAFHPFRGSALVRDPGARALHIQPTSDHGADRDAAPVALADYLDELVATRGTDRRVDGRYIPVRSRG